MISKKEVKYIQSLSDKKNRDREDVFVAEGPKLINELIAGGLKPQTIYTTGSQDKYKNLNVEVREITADDLGRISRWETPNEAAAVFYKKKLPQLQLSDTFTLALDGIQDPGNLGTIIRTADWFGITQVVASPDTADCYNSKVVQSTMGSLPRVNVYYTDLAATLANVDVPVIGALLQGKNLYEIPPLPSGILIIGNEAKGIRSHVLPLVQQAVTIPRIGNAESLNAAVATGILLSHLVRSKR